MNEETRTLMFSSLNPDWGTPQDFYDELNKKYNFTIDLCANEKNHKHESYITPEDDFLNLKVILGVGFMNPPYNKPEHPCNKKCTKKTCVKRGFHIKEYVPGQIDFVRHASYLAQLGLLTTVALLPARTDTQIFHKYIWDKDKKQFREGVKADFVKGRIRFETEDGPTDPAPFPSMVVVFHKKLL